MADPDDERRARITALLRGTGPIDEHDPDDEPDERGDPYAGHRQPDGRFLPGHGGGPGRRPGTPRLSFSRIVVEKCEQHGVDIGDVVFETFVGLAMRASLGDPAAAKILLDRLCGPVVTAPAVAVQLNGNGTTDEPGPPVPRREAFGSYVTRMLDIAVTQGLVQSTTEAAVDDAVAKVRRVDELLG